MKVLLVNTNRMKPAIAPIGLDYLADSLISAGHEPRLLDLCFSDDVMRDVEGAVREHAPDAVGATVRNTDDCYFASGAFFLPGIRDIVSSLHRRCGSPVVLGGVGYSVMPEAVVEFCGADFGIAGEGEEAFVRLLGALGHEIDAVLERPGDAPAVALGHTKWACALLRRSALVAAGARVLSGAGSRSCFDSLRTSRGTVVVGLCSCSVILALLELRLKQAKLVTNSSQEVASPCIRQPAFSR